MKLAASLTGAVAVTLVIASTGLAGPNKDSSPAAASAAASFAVLASPPARSAEADRVNTVGVYNLGAGRLDPARTRELGVVDERRLWLLAGSDDTCFATTALVGVELTMTCQPTADLAERPLMLSEQQSHGPVRVDILVPDGARIAVRGHGGERRSATVSTNHASVYTEPDATVEFTDRAGNVRSYPALAGRPSRLP